MARKEKYQDSFPELARKYAEEGLNDEQIAEKLGISGYTFYQYQKKYPKFSQAIKRGKENPDKEVENAAFKSAQGHTVTLRQQRVLSNGEIVEYEQEIHYPPNPTGYIFWLVNRMPDRWRSINKDREEKRDDEPTAADILKALGQSTPTRYAIPTTNGTDQVQDSSGGKAKRKD